MTFLTRLLLTFVLSFSLVELPLLNSSTAHAGMISTSEAMTQMSRTQSEIALSEFLGRSDVMDQMIKLGVNPEEAKLRLAGLSDTEVQSLSQDISEANAGATVGGVLVLVLVILLIIYFAKRV